MATTTANAVFGRQLDLTSASSMIAAHCTPFILPSNGLIQFGASAITLTTDVVFQPECTGSAAGQEIVDASLRDPFYSSTIPQVYMVAATTVIAWVLVIMVFITPRTAFWGISDTTPRISYGHGIIGGANGGTNNWIGAGSRPWLQKVATLSAAVSLTIATVNTFTIAKRQYMIGRDDAYNLGIEVQGSLEMRIVLVISDIFLWLAQVQTLIRLFPRHKEKVLIKWIGFVLIVLDTIFSCLNSFVVNDVTKPPHFKSAIPALQYLFELAIELLYAAWVIYYAMTKRRYAFYHSKMRNICIIALLSLVAVLTPVVFFVTDISDADLSEWGNYFRWVGAAAASVVVWEWVERIEALERDERKDGILGREVFDGDEMLEVMAGDEPMWIRSMDWRNDVQRPGDDDFGSGHNQSSALEYGLNNVAQRFRPRMPLKRKHNPTSRTDPTTARPSNAELAHPARLDGNVDLGDSTAPITPGSQAAPAGSRVYLHTGTPVSRADSTSAASTMYVVRYHPVADTPRPIRFAPNTNMPPGQSPARVGAQEQQSISHDRENVEEGAAAGAGEGTSSNRLPERQWWQSARNPFKRKRASPPREVQQARAAAANINQAMTPAHNFSRWDLKNRLGVLAAETGDKFRDRVATRKEEIELPVVVIPAQPRGSGRMWSPAMAEPRDSEHQPRTDTSNMEQPSPNVDFTSHMTPSHTPEPPRAEAALEADQFARMNEHALHAANRAARDTGSRVSDPITGLYEGHAQHLETVPPEGPARDNEADATRNDNHDTSSSSPLSSSSAYPPGDHPEA